MDTDHEPHVNPWPGLIERPARGTGSWPDQVWVVFVHGAMDRGAGMAHLARALRDAPTIRYDRRGYGRARALPTGDLVGHVDDLIGIVAGRPVVLFGHSFGGLVVLAAAATGRLDVRGVATWEVPAPWITGWGGWSPSMQGRSPATVAEDFMRAAVGPQRWESLPERTRQARRAEGPSLLADMDPVLSAGAPFDPSRITAPCVFGAGEISPAPYPAAARWLAGHIAGARVRVIPDAPHGAPMSRPGEIASLIRSVLDADHHGGESGRGDDAVTV